MMRSSTLQYAIAKAVTVLTLTVASSQASVIYTVTGVFDGAAPVSTWSSPNTAFSLLFSVQEPITPTVFDANQWDMDQPLTFYLGSSLVGSLTSPHISRDRDCHRHILNPTKDWKERLL